MAQKPKDGASALVTKSQAQSKTTIQPKISWKGHGQFRHDLFKLEVAHMKKDKQAWKKGQPRILDVEHVHFMHTFDSKGKKLKYSEVVGGHYHEVTVTMDATGELVAHCGPALQTVDKKLKNGKYKKVIVPVSFETLDDGPGLIDNHTHEISYISSELLSPMKIRQVLGQSTHQAQQMGGFSTVETVEGPQMPMETDLTVGASIGGETITEV